MLRKAKETWTKLRDSITCVTTIPQTDCKPWSAAVSPAGHGGAAEDGPARLAERHALRLPDLQVLWDLRGVSDPGGGRPPLASCRHPTDPPTFDASADLLTQSKVPKKAICDSTRRGARKAVVAQTRRSRQAALLLPQVDVASRTEQVWPSVSLAEMFLLEINHFLFFFLRASTEHAGVSLLAARLKLNLTERLHWVKFECVFAVLRDFFFVFLETRLV